MPLLTRTDHATSRSVAARMLPLRTFAEARTHRCARSMRGGDASGHDRSWVALAAGLGAEHRAAAPARFPRSEDPRSPALLAVRAVARRPGVPDTVVNGAAGGRHRKLSGAIARGRCTGGRTGRFSSGDPGR